MKLKGPLAETQQQHDNEASQGQKYDFTKKEPTHCRAGRDTDKVKKLVKHAVPIFI